MSDVNAVIVQPFKQFGKVASRCVENEHCRDTTQTRRRPERRRPAPGTRPGRRRAGRPRAPSSPRRPNARAPSAPPRRETHHATTHTPPSRRRRRRDTDTSPTQDSIHLVKKCTKPDRKEFARIASATMIGFLIMGFVGFFVKLVHIPINNILMT